MFFLRKIVAAIKRELIIGRQAYDCANNRHVMIVIQEIDDSPAGRFLVIRKRCSFCGEAERVNNADIDFVKNNIRPV